jgi:hypothetical protein
MPHCRSVAIRVSRSYPAAVPSRPPLPCTLVSSPVSATTSLLALRSELQSSFSASSAWCITSPRHVPLPASSSTSLATRTRTRCQLQQMLTAPLRRVVAPLPRTVWSTITALPRSVVSKTMRNHMQLLEYNRRIMLNFLLPRLHRVKQPTNSGATRTASARCAIVRSMFGAKTTLRNAVHVTVLHSNIKRKESLEAADNSLRQQRIAIRQQGHASNEIGHRTRISTAETGNSSVAR